MFRKLFLAALVLFVCAAVSEAGSRKLTIAGQKPNTTTTYTTGVFTDEGAVKGGDGYLKGAQVTWTPTDKKIKVNTTSGSGNATIKKMTFSSTAGNKVTIPQTVINKKPQYIPLYGGTATTAAAAGRLDAYEKAMSVAKTLTVTGASTKSLKLTYKTDVGIAKNTTYSSPTTFGKVLSAKVKAGSSMASYTASTTPGSFVRQWSLSSKVDPTGTLAADATAPGSVGSGWGTGLVGSEAEIVAATTQAAVSKPTMAWRGRSPTETSGPITVPGSSAQYLTSDAVKIAAVASDATYALQMTFDNRINLAKDGQAGGTIEKEWGSMFIAKMDEGTGVWEKVGLGAGVQKSLQSFLEENAGTSLAALEGSWGVDVAGTQADTQQRGHSWVIMKNTGGVFAVVPEPATVLMMISATVGALAYGWRRWSRKSRLPA